MPRTSSDNEPDNGELFSSQSYPQRQMIVVVDDSMAEAERRAAIRPPYIQGLFMK